MVRVFKLDYILIKFLKGMYEFKNIVFYEENY